MFAWPGDHVLQTEAWRDHTGELTPGRVCLLHDGLPGLRALPRPAQDLLPAPAEGLQVERRVWPATPGRKTESLL